MANLDLRHDRPARATHEACLADRLAAIRAAVGPDIVLRADANQGYSPKEAIRLCRLCERRGVGLELLEQPVPKWDLAGMAQVRAAVDVLIEADESAYTQHDVVQIVRAGAADVINIKIGKAGGLYQAKKIAVVAEAAGSLIRLTEPDCAGRGS